MNALLWAVAGLLAAVFLVGGGLKIILPKEQLRDRGRMRGRDLSAWTEDFSGSTIKTIGVLEVLAAVGLIVPPVVGIAPVLAPLAALGLVLVMLGAAVVHIRRRELPHLAANVVYLVLAATVVWGRLVVEPFAA